MKNDWQATVIKVGAVVTAAPRWVGALLAAEGFPIPADWMWWWIPLSAIMSAAMAVVEGMAFAYVFSAWRNQKDKSSNILFGMAVGTATVFVLVLAPYIAASVKKVGLYEMLYGDVLLYIWSICVGLSTIAIVASVGYAQKQKDTQPAQTKTNKETKSEQPEHQQQQLESKPQELPKLAGTKAQVYAILLENPVISNPKVAEQIGKSPELVRQYRHELQNAGYLNGGSKNGNGVAH